MNEGSSWLRPGGCAFEGRDRECAFGRPRALHAAFLKQDYLFDRRSLLREPWDGSHAMFKRSGGCGSLSRGRGRGEGNRASDYLWVSPMLRTPPSVSGG